MKFHMVENYGKMLLILRKSDILPHPNADPTPAASAQVCKAPGEPCRPE